MITAAEELIHNAYAAFNARDIDAALRTMHPDIEWPKAFEGGYVQGPAEIRSYWTRQWSEINPQVTPVTISLKSTDELEVTVQQLVKDLDGAILFDGLVKHCYRLQDGLLRKMDIQLL